jgi:hypothetical protein
VILMAYQAGTLLAAGGDVYEQLMDIIKSFSETAGWSTNLYDDDSSYYEAGGTYHASGGYAGKRLHMQKTINGTVRCINIKSCFNECPTYHAYSTYGLVSGLAINGSTGFATTGSMSITSVANAGSGRVLLYCTNTKVVEGQSVTVSGTTNYNGIYTVYSASGSYIVVTATYTSSQTGTITFGTRWEEQTGATYSGGGGSVYVTSAAFDIPTDILNYYLVHITSGLADLIYLQVQNLKGYVGFLFGTTSLDVFVVGGSANTGFENVNIEGRNSLLYYSYEESWGNSFAALYTGGTFNGWYCLKSDTTIGVHLPYQRLYSMGGYGNYEETFTLLYCSPDNFKGNTPLIPVNLQIVNSSSLKKDIGTLPGVKYVNMQNIASLREETYGADTWKFFRQYSTDDIYKKTGGLAFLIS